MKKINIYRLSVVAFTLVLIVSAVTYAKITQKNIAESVLRLHVVANSDSEADQKLKMAVRDRVLKEAKEIFENVSSAKEAEKLAREKADFLETIANDELQKQGYNCLARVEIGEFAFPVKFYDDIMLPSGRYSAVKITIGEGKGRNWWCVMYPPMCSLEGITMDNGKESLKKSLSREEYEMISSKNKKAEVRFKIVDIINSVI